MFSPLLQLRTLLEQPAFAAIVNPAVETWFAVHTYAKHEKVVAQETRDLGITTFLPVVKQATPMVRPAQAG